MLEKKSDATLEEEEGVTYPSKSKFEKKKFFLGFCLLDLIFFKSVKFSEGTGTRNTREPSHI